MPVLDVTDASARRELSSDLLNSPSMPTTPTGGSAKAAGYDLYSAYNYTSGPVDKAIVKTDIPEWPRDPEETGVVLFNFVAQLVCERICNPDLVEQETLDETERGAGGFGSIGSN
uniref:Deoxyuridine 5'-triphosphate nucleotidohydrolase n=1 Tax=Mola mola TaxID=94237 RepID=A0A3Q3W0C6_MOLML